MTQPPPGSAKPTLLVVDSIQAVRCSGLESVPGSVSQVREAASRFVAWAKKIGPATCQVIQTRLAAKVHPEQAYRSCLGILGLAKRYSDTRLEAACVRAVGCGISRYRGIKNILDSRFDQLELELSEPTPEPQPAHPNVRGPGYFH